MKNYIINENKYAKIFGNIGLGIFVLAFVSSIILTIISIFKIVDPVVGLGVLLLSLPITLVPMLISLGLSTRDKQTSKYLNQIRDRISDNFDVDDLKVIRAEFIDEAVDEHKMIRIGYPQSVKNIITELNHKIEVLEKVKNNVG